MKNLAFLLALLLLTGGAIGFFVPSFLVWIAQHSVTPGAFLGIGAARAVLGLVLISVASESRAPRTVRVLGWLILILGILTALAGLVAIDRARAEIDWWVAQGSGVVRLTSLFFLALMGFIAYACAPARRPPE